MLKMHKYQAFVTSLIFVSRCIEECVKTRIFIRLIPGKFNVILMMRLINFQKRDRLIFFRQPI